LQGANFHTEQPRCSPGTDRFEPSDNDKIKKWQGLKMDRDNTLATAAPPQTTQHVVIAVTRIACRQAATRRAGTVLAVLTLLATASIAGPATAQRTAGRSDSEIRIGNTMPYTGPAAAYGIVGKTIAAYFNKINIEGGINGRRIRFISYDDSYNSAKTVELTRRLVEDDKVLVMFAGLGTAPNAAVRPYLNTNKTPQLFVASGASTWDQPREFPWTLGFQPSYQTEAHIYAQYLLENHGQGAVRTVFRRPRGATRDGEPEGREVIFKEFRQWQASRSIGR
jgi:ABC-type branched-subunit amino acid transport system substrate-binding protein